MKRIVTVQDISCLGKCSLTVALPVISAMGVEAAVIPTAVLSTHTMFSRFTFRDLTDEIPAILDHWAEENFQFDAIYTGYLGSLQQLSLVEDLFCRFDRGSTLKIVDPVMADHGRLYTGFTPEFVKAMAKLCGKADIILPNMTEASFMLEVPYTKVYDRAYIEEMLKKLTGLGAKCAVLTGVSFEEGKVGFMGYDSRTREFFEYYNDRVPAAYHGTGDIFASVVTGGMARGLSLFHALQIAADYTAQCIRVTLEDPKSAAYGVNFEAVIPELVHRINEFVKEAAI